MPSIPMIYYRIVMRISQEHLVSVAGLWAFTVVAVTLAAQSQTTSSTTTTRPADNENLLYADTSFELGDVDWCVSTRREDDLQMGLIIDTRTAAHGTCSAVLMVEPEQKETTLRIPLPMDNTNSEPNRCISMFLKASEPHSVLAAISTGSAAQLSRFKVQQQWKRFSIAFKTSRQTAPTPLILTPERATEPYLLWLDAVKLESGSAPTAYQPCRRPLVTLSVPTTSGLLYHQQLFEIKAGFRCDDSPVSQRTLRWQLGRAPSAERSGEVTITPQTTSPLVLWKGSLERGWYPCTAEWIDGITPLARPRPIEFGVVRPIAPRRQGAPAGFQVLVPPHGPRSDACARAIGLTVLRESTTGLATTPSTATSPIPPSVDQTIASFTRRRAAGDPRAFWASAWNELLDDRGRWQPIAVATNVWLDLLDDTEPLRSIRCNTGHLRIEVFSRPDRTVAVVLPLQPVSGTERLLAHLPSPSVQAMDLLGSPIRIADHEGGLAVDLRAGVLYLVANTTLTRGRFALELERARVVASP